MKNKVNLIVILFFFVNSYFACFGQALTEQDYSELASLFKEDVRLMGDTREAYSNYQSTRLRAPFSYSRILTLSKNPNLNTGTNKILVIVNSSIYNQLPDRIERYAYDINYVYGCEVIMETVTGGDHTNIKSLITSNQTNLNGAVFIGDIAVAWYEVANDYDGYAPLPDKEGYGYKLWPCDLYYMDINGIWTDADGNGIYDAHTGSVQPEIFVGRISTANMGTLLSEKEGLEKYLDKNHKFWMGHTTVNKKFGLSYTSSDWANYSYFRTNIQYLYGNTNYDQVKYGDAVFGKTDYLSRLTNNRYEFIQIAFHADYYYMSSLSGGYLYSNEIFNNGTQAIGYNLFCCSGCNWTAVSSNSNRGFLGGSHVYNANNSSLVAVGSTKTGSMLNFDKFYTPLGQGKTIGESLINFYHCMNNRCVSQITLNSFDTSNTASHRYIVAKEKIIVNNYVIPSGKHVIFNAKEVELNAGFECQLGGSFEIINEGCMSNCP